MGLGRRVPYIPQQEAVECGAASLAMILAYYGHHAPLAEVREACAVSRDGSSASRIVAAAKEYGLKVRARRLEPEALAAIKQPSILHWEMNHFLVLQKWTPSTVHLVDPALGPRTVSAADFDNSFTGICLTFEPGEDFVRRKRRPLSLARYLAVLRGAWGALGLVLLLTVMLNALGLTLPLVTQLVLDRVVLPGQASWLNLLGAAIFGLLAIELLSSCLRGGILTSTQRFLDTTTSVQFVRHLLRLPLGFLQQRSTADLVNRVQSNRVLRDVLAGQSISVLVDGLLLVSYLVVMLTMSVRLGLTVAATGLVYATIFLLARRYQFARYQAHLIKQVKADSELYQIVRGMITLKCSGTEEASHGKWMGLHINALNEKVREARLSDRLGAGLLLLQSLVPVVVLYVGGRSVLQGSMTVGLLIAFLMIQRGFLKPLDLIIQALLRAQIVPVLLERMDDVLEASPEPAGKEMCPALKGQVAFQKVTFSYGRHTPQVLQDVSFVAEPGSKIALVGPSGSGKSSIAKLLLGMYTPNSGEILIDGQDLARFDPVSVRRQVGVVLQETVLFTGTVRDNLSLYVPNASFEDVMHAARAAQIHDDILALPCGYDTLLSSSSTALSGGQRQRLALARAILHRPPIIVLDEATSALDAVTESAIERYLSTRRCTRIVIAHRLSTVRDADQILVLEGGQILERGTHDALLQQEGLYARLATASDRAQACEEPGEEPQGRLAEDILGPFPALGGLAAEEAAALAGVLQRVSYDVSAVILYQDDKPSGLFLLEEGEVEVRITEPGLPPYVVATLGPGEVFGEVSLLDGSPNSATVVACTPARLLCLPLRQFQELRSKRDSVARHLLLALGKIVSQRVCETTAARREIERTLARPASPLGVVAERTTGARRVTLAETAFGGSFTSEELKFLHQIGEEREYRAGEVLFSEGDPSEDIQLVLSGRVAVTAEGFTQPLATLRPGLLLGDLVFFDGGPRSATCVSLEPSTVFSLRIGVIHSLLAANHPVAWKILEHLVRSIVWHFRLTNIALREEAAHRDGEPEKALRARMQAEEGHEHMVGDLAAEPAERPVLTRDPQAALPACLTWALRYYGRQVPLASVTETYAEVLSASEASLADVARVFGFRLRTTLATLEDLRPAATPLLLQWGEKHTVVALGARAGGRALMDPAQGHRIASWQEVREHFTGTCYEVTPNKSLKSHSTTLERAIDFLRDHRHACVVLGLASAFLQAVGLVVPLLTGLLVETVFPSRGFGLLRLIALGMLSLVAFECVLTLSRASALRFLRIYFDRSMLDQLLGHVLRLPVSYFETTPSAETLQRFDSFRLLGDVLTDRGLLTVLDLGAVCLSIVACALVDVSLAAMLCGVVVLHGIALLGSLRWLQRQAQQEIQCQNETQERLLEVLAGVATLRVTGAPEGGVRRWIPSLDRELSVSSREQRFSAVLLPALQFIRSAFLGLVLWWGARAVLSHRLGVGELVAFQGVAASCLAALGGITLNFLAYVRSAAHLGNLQRAFDQAPEQHSELLSPPGRLRGRIAIEHVSFRYTAEGPLVLKDVSLAVEPGMKVALVGRSGSGKSTLGKVLLGAYLPTSGQVLFDGKDLSHLDLGALRRQIGTVLQETFLFGASIRDNLRMASPDADLERLRKAATLAAIADDIERLPMGYETILSEGGSTFSGGQRQRLAIARALVNSPAILLLDEATSALDNLSQAAVERNLGRTACTRIVVAHRLSTIRDADLIAVLERGMIVEKGTHDELVTKKGAYWELVKNQVS